MKEGKVSPEAKVGILVLAGIVLLFFMSFRISRLERVRGEVYTALFPSVSGLVINSDVEVAGVPVGKVEKIGLEKGKAKVWMKVGQVELHRDAEAIIKTHGVLGDKYIEIKPGSPGAPLLQPGGTITRVRSAPDMDQLFVSLESAARGMGDLGQSLREVIGEEEGKNAIRELVINLKEASSDFREVVKDNKDKVGNIIANLEDFSHGLKPLSQRAERTLANLEEISAKVRAGQGTLGKLLTDEALYYDAKEALASFRRVMVKVEKGEGSLGKLMTDDTFSQEAEKTMRKMQKASEGVQEQTPITTLGALLGLFF
ncbi:MAG: MCE family protein [Deltaproteobacteria bacterium]|nr:MCE family protein [Deltaproteobacteria bacterium]